MRKIKHVWEYLTSPSYRLFCDLMLSQEVVNRRLNEMKEQIELSSIAPPFRDTFQKYRAIYGTDIRETAALIKAQHNISS